MILLAYVFLMLAAMVNGYNDTLTGLFVIGIFLSLYDGGKLWTILTGFPTRNL